MNNPNIGKTIKLLRQAKQMRQQDLADAVGLSVAYICLVEQNKRDIKFSVMKKISAALGVPTFMLLLIAENIAVWFFNPMAIEQLTKTIFEAMEMKSDATELLNNTASQ